MMRPKHVEPASVFLGLSMLAMTLPSQALAQDVFQLTAPGIASPSTAIRHPDRLVIRDGGGQETSYRREPQLDSADAQWVGYYSSQARQALQWPVANQGAMRIGTQQADRSWQFRPSRMSIQGVGGGRNGPRFDRAAGGFPGLKGGEAPILPGVVGQPPGGTSALPLDAQRGPIPIRLGMGEEMQRRFLGRPARGGLDILPPSALGDQSWYVVPLANGMVRIQYVDQGTILALGARSPSGPLDLYAFADRADQLWRIHPYSGVGGSYALESLQYPGYALSHYQNQLRLAPLAYAPYQQWWPTAPVVPVLEPLYRSVQQSIVPNPPLAAADVQLLNSHGETLIALIADQRVGGAPQKIRIPRGGSHRLAMDRDSGGTLVEIFEVRSPYGAWDRREFRTPIPPMPIYDISVYEEFLQSIAIDRTGSSPNPIEDINYQPRSVGMFVVPAGSGLPDQTSLDLHALAEAAQNPGAVRRLQPKDYDSKTPASDPLGDLLREIQSRRAAF